MTDSVFAEYNTMKKRYDELVLDEKKLLEEHEDGVKYFIDNRISDKEWQDNLEKSACHLASASVTLKIGGGKMKQIGIILHKKHERN